MFKSKNKLAAILLVASISTPAAADIRWDAAKTIYDYFFGNIVDWGWGIDEAAKSDARIGQIYAETNRYIDSGYWTYEPSFSLPYLNNRYSSWSENHMATCVDTNAFREMPITNVPDSWVNYTSPLSYKTVQIKQFTVQQGVPSSFSSKTHGGFTDWVSDSFYFWSFGDGIRRFNKNGDDEEGTHTYNTLGRYYLSSIVYSESWSVFVGIEGTQNADLSVAQSKLNTKLERHGSLYLEGCDFAQVNVVPNNAPTARIAQGSTKSTSRYTIVSLNGKYSSDPDSNPLTYTWNINGATQSGQIGTLHVPTPEARGKYYTVTLTVSDGDKSDATTRSIYVAPYCYSCNGEYIP